jgi:4-amino-4-deoxy-L-arabinose transferase-like glycosyltransferase
VRTEYGIPAIILVLVLVGAFLLRVSGNLYDMPYGFHPDEKQYLHNALRMMSEGAPRPVDFRNPPLYSYAILLSLYALFAGQYAIGHVAGIDEFVSRLPPQVRFGTARVLTALAGTGTGLLLCLIGRRFGGTRAGLVAAFLYSVAFVSVREAHFAVNDTAMVFLVTLAFLFALRWCDHGRGLDLLFGGLVAGLATATKYNGMVAILPLVAALAVGQHGRDRLSGPAGIREAGSRGLGLLIAAMIGFLLGNPYAALDGRAFLSGLTAQYGYRGMSWGGQTGIPVPLLVFETLSMELGWPLLLAVPVALWWCLARGGARSKAASLAFIPALGLVLYHSSQRLFFARFMLPCTPFIVLICAWGIVGCLDESRAFWTRRRFMLWALVAVLAALPFARSLKLTAILHQRDTRILATRYLERIAPAGSSVVREIEMYYTPPLDPGRYRLPTLSSDPSRYDPTAAPADYYVFSSFVTGRWRGISDAGTRVLKLALERRGFTRITFGPLRERAELPFEIEQVYLPYRRLFQYERPGPEITIYARPGMPLPSAGGLHEADPPGGVSSRRIRGGDRPYAGTPGRSGLVRSARPESRDAARPTLFAQSG